MIKPGDSHVDGGTFEPAIIIIKRKIGNMTFFIPAEGLRCSQCDYEVISRDTALWLESTENNFMMRTFQDPEQGYTGTIFIPNIEIESMDTYSESECVRQFERTSRSTTEVELIVA